MHWFTYEFTKPYSATPTPQKMMLIIYYLVLYFIAVVHVPRDFYNSELGLLN